MVLKKYIHNSDKSIDSSKEIGKNNVSKKRLKIQSEGNDSYPMSSQSKALRDLGKSIIKNMPRADYDKLSSKSETLHFVRLLGLDSKRTTRTTIENKQRVYNSGIYGSPKPVGITLRSEIDIVVPEIDVTINKDTGIDIENDLKYREVKAGVEFDLSLYELMFLMLEDEYAGYFRFDDDQYGVHLEMKVKNAIDVDEDGNITLKVIEEKDGNKIIKLPTPTIKFSKGSVRAGAVGIDEIGPDGLWRIKPGYEKFVDLVVNKKSTNRRTRLEQ